MAVIDSAELLLQAKNYSGSGNWLDESGNGHHAVPGAGGAAPTFDTDHFDFDGGDVFTISDDANLDSGTGEDITVMVVFRLPGVTSAWGRLVAKSDDVTFWEIFMDTSVAPPRVQARLDDDTNVVDVNNQPATAYATVHVGAMVRDAGTDVRTYLDGTLNTSGAVNDTAGDLSNATDMTIGRNAWGGNPYTGEIMAVALWRSALSAADIATAGGELLALTELQTVIRPISDTAGTGWDSAPTGSQDLFAQVDEVVASDTDYIYTTDPNP